MARVESRYGDGNEREHLTVTAVDATLATIQLMVKFDPEDLDVAMAELDRLHAELAPSAGWLPPMTGGVRLGCSVTHRLVR